MNAERKLVLYIAMSLDGYIAGPGDDLSFLSAVEKEGEDYGYTSFIETVDTVILGRKTYDWVMKQVNQFPHANNETYIITRTPRPAVGKVQFYTGDLVTLLHDLKAKSGRNIFCDGGAEVVNALLKDALIDEMIISIIPVLLHGGTRLFGLQAAMQPLTLAGCQAFEKGLVQLHYRLQKEVHDAAGHFIKNRGSNQNPASPELIITTEASFAGPKKKKGQNISDLS